MKVPQTILCVSMRTRKRKIPRVPPRDFSLGYLSDLCLSNHLLMQLPATLAITDNANDTMYSMSSTSFPCQIALTVQKPTMFLLYHIINEYVNTDRCRA